MQGSIPLTFKNIFGDFLVLHKTSTEIIQGANLKKLIMYSCYILLKVSDATW